MGRRYRRRKSNDGVEAAVGCIFGIPLALLSLGGLLSKHGKGEAQGCGGLLLAVGLVVLAIYVLILCFG